MPFPQSASSQAQVPSAVSGLQERLESLESRIAALTAALTSAPHVAPDALATLGGVSQRRRFAAAYTGELTSFRGRERGMLSRLFEVSFILHNQTEAVIEAEPYIRHTGLTAEGGSERWASLYPIGKISLPAKVGVTPGRHRVVLARTGTPIITAGELTMAPIPEIYTYFGEEVNLENLGGLTVSDIAWRYEEIPVNPVHYEE